MAIIFALIKNFCLKKIQDDLRKCNYIPCISWNVSQFKKKNCNNLPAERGHLSYVLSLRTSIILLFMTNSRNQDDESPAKKKNCLEPAEVIKNWQRPFSNFRRKERIRKKKKKRKLLCWKTLSLILQFALVS